MKRAALAALALAAAIPSWGAYTYYYTYQNGSVQFGSSGFSSAAYSEGTLISKVAVPDGTSEYEVKATLTNPSSLYGAFYFYLDATPNADASSNTGNFYVVEYDPYLGGYLTVRWVNGGTGGTVGSGSASPHNGMVFRVVRRADGQIIIYVDNNIVFWGKDTTILSGQPGIGFNNYLSGTGAYTSQVQRKRPRNPS